MIGTEFVFNLINDSRGMLIKYQTKFQKYVPAKNLRMRNLKSNFNKLYFQTFAHQLIYYWKMSE